MNGRYTLANTPGDRIAIAAVAAVDSYFRQHPQGVMPGQGFFAEYLKPFIERELLEARIDELHKRLGHIGGRERELVEAHHRALAECSARITS